MYVLLVRQAFKQGPQLVAHTDSDGVNETGESRRDGRLPQEQLDVLGAARRYATVMAVRLEFTTAMEDCEECMLNWTTARAKVKPSGNVTKRVPLCTLDLLRYRRV